MSTMLENNIPKPVFDSAGTFIGAAPTTNIAAVVPTAAVAMQVNDCPG